MNNEDVNEMLDNAIKKIQREILEADLGESAFNIAGYSFEDFVNSVESVIDECAEILISKQKDYGPYNISRAPGGPLNGLRVRIYDKISRINNLIEENNTPKHESLRDSFLDLANYGIIGLMVLDGTWPKMERDN
jgi:hypothetical protein